MGLRNPVFTNVISIVDYSANLSEVYQLAKTAVTGERTQPATSQEAPVPVTQEPAYDEYDSPEETYEEADESTGESVKDKVKDFFSNIFD